MKAPPEAANLEFIPEDGTDTLAKDDRGVHQTAKQVATKVAAPQLPHETTQVDADTENQPFVLRKIFENISNARSFLKEKFHLGIEASNSVLLRLKERFKPPTEENTSPASIDTFVRKRKAPARETEENQKSAPASLAEKPRSRLRNIFIFLLGSVISAMAGMIFSYTLLSTMIVNQAQKIDVQMDELSQLERQYSKILTSEARYRNENQVCQKELEDAEQELAQLTADKQLSAQVPPAGSSTAARQPAPERVVNCYLGTEATARDITRCINVYNHR